jgi:hypothetical protein
MNKHYRYREFSVANFAILIIVRYLIEGETAGEVADDAISFQIGCTLDWSRGHMSCR